jgi:DNA-binding PadR family transcriptional regulator
MSPAGPAIGRCAPRPARSRSRRGSTTHTVRALERDGLVTRTVHASVPPRVDYELTELGQTLLIPLGALADWANTHRGDIQAACDRHDRQVGDGHLERPVSL